MSVSMLPNYVKYGKNYIMLKLALTTFN